MTAALRLDTDPLETGAELLDVIESAIDRAPRSLQRRIGPSQLGNPCDWCLAHSLAGAPEQRDGGAWLPAIGTAVHAWLDDVFAGDDAQRYAQIAAELPLPEPRWWRETRVSVGEVDGVEITGSCDLYDSQTGLVVDWKITGPTTIKKTKSGGPALGYRRQAHLYGRGFVRRGLPVSHVMLAFLPRSDVSVRSGYLWTEPYDEQVALDALARADRLAKAVRLFGIDVLAPSLERAPAGSCFSCSRYPNADGTAPPAPGDWRSRPAKPAATGSLFPVAS